MSKDLTDDRKERRLEREGLIEKIRELEAELKARELQLEALRKERSQQLPPAVKAFLSEWFGTIEELEVLMLILSRPDDGWKVAGMSEQLGASTLLVEKCVAGLSRKGLIEARPPGSEAYYPGASSPAGKDLLHQLHHAYATDRPRVVGVLLSKMQQSAMKFADAFRVRKDGVDQ